MRYEELHEEIIGGTAAGSLPSWAMSVLEDITAGRRTVPAVRHPLGFLCLPVERRSTPGGRLGVCLHLWSPRLAQVTTTTSQIHCHSWDLVSFVLYGKVRNVPARICDAEDGATHQVFEVLSRGDTDEILATGRAVRYTPGIAREHGRGEVYTLPAGAFHSTAIGGDLHAATIALGRQARDGGDLSLGDPSLGDPSLRDPSRRDPSRRDPSLGDPSLRDPSLRDLSLGDLDTPTHHVRRLRCGPRETARAALLSAERLAAAHAA